MIFSVITSYFCTRCSNFSLYIIRSIIGKASTCGGANGGFAGCNSVFHVAEYEEDF